MASLKRFIDRIVGRDADGMDIEGPRKLIVEDNKVGDGPEAYEGNIVSVHYTGWLYEPDSEDHKGQRFDSSHDRDQAFSFTLGARHVIRGWDEGVEGMKVGGVRTLFIPSAWGYGEKGAGDAIPPNAALVFEVELLRVVRKN